MDSTQRREQIMERITCAEGPISATKLAGEFGVSRQIIVGDIALLRAAGAEIDATPRGYVLRGAEGGTRRVRIVCRHDSAGVEEELNILVDNGCRVIDVIVEHPVYGQLTGLLDLSSRYDIRCFLAQCAEAGAHSLLELTDGIHLHTVEYSDPEAYAQAVEELRERGFLYEA